MSLIKSELEWLRVVRASLAIFISWNMAGCATVSHQQLQEAALSQVSLPSLKAKAKKALDAGQFVEAARWYELAIDKTDDEGLVREATVSAYEHAQWQSAIRCAKRWLSINPTSQEAHENAAFAAVRLYQVDVATEHLDALVGSAYISPASGFLQLLPKIQVLDASAALATMQNLAQKYPQIAEAHYVVAKLASQTAHQALMLSEAQRAHELSAYWSPAGLTLAHAQLAGNQVEHALATAKSVIANDGSIATRSEYAAILLEAGKINDAVLLLKELEKSTDDVGPALLLLAQIELQSGEFQAAFDHYSRLMSGSSRASEALYGMAQISERAGILDSARQLYARVQEGEFALPAQVRLAQIIQKQDGVDAALASLKQYGDSNPDKFLEVLRSRAELLIASGNNKAAMELYDQSIANYPDEASLKLARAFLLIKLDKIDSAIAAMKLMVTERPEDPIALNALGYTLVDRTHDVRQGYALIQHAMRYSPDSGAVLDSMGWAEYKMGHVESALTYIQRASTRTVDADLDLHLGEVLWSLKRYDDAVAAWRVGLTHAPKHVQLLKRIQMAEKQHKGSASPPQPPNK